MIEFQGYDCKMVEIVPQFVPEIKFVAGAKSREKIEVEADYARDENREGLSVKLEDSMVSIYPNTYGTSSTRLFLLPIQLVGVRHPSSEDKSDEYEIIGFQILSNNSPGSDDVRIIYSFRFAFPMSHESKKIRKGIINGTLLINADDGKMNTTVADLGTCSATFKNCPKCLKRHDDFSLPLWVKEEYGHLFPEEVQFKDFELRVGKYSYEACKEIRTDIIGEKDDHITGKKNTSTNIDKTKSVLNQPLRPQSMDTRYNYPLFESTSATTIHGHEV